jgi:hypothetical protein
MSSTAWADHRQEATTATSRKLVAAAGPPDSAAAAFLRSERNPMPPARGAIAARRRPGRMGRIGRLAGLAAVGIAEFGVATSVPAQAAGWSASPSAHGIDDALMNLWND